MSNLRAKLTSLIGKSSKKSVIDSSNSSLLEATKELSTDLNVSSLRHTAHLMALEPRIALDAAAVATGIEVLADQPGDGFDGQSANQDAKSFDATNELADALVDSAAGSTLNEIIFIDSSIENYQTLLQGIGPSIEVVILDATRDGVEQIAEVLAGRTDIDAIHIIAHGGIGEMKIGNATLDSESIAGEYADELAIIGDALTSEGDILIYGCEFGKGQAGEQAVAALAQATGADIAASSDDTGSQNLGGDWDLEVKTGEIEAEIAVSQEAQSAFTEILPITITNTADAGTLANAIFGSGVTVLDSSTPGVSDPNYAGTVAQAGTFTGGLTSGYLSFDDGVILSSGDA